MKISNKQAYRLIFLISLLGIVFSLYYGYYGDLYQNILDGVLFDTERAIKPCEMCWYIRIAQYPMALIAGLALIKDEFSSSRLYLIWLSIIWVILSGYKFLLEQGVIEVAWSGLCGVDSAIPCDGATYLMNTPLSFAGAGLLAFIISLVLLKLKK